MHPSRPVRRLALAALLLLSSLGAAAADEAGALRALIARGDLNAALQRADKAVAAKPTDAELAFLRGVVLMDLGRDADALAAFTLMTEQYPELPDPFNNIALLRARTGEYELARQALESALRNDPGHRLARANLGRVHLMLAAQAWEQLAAQGPLDLGLQRALDGVRAIVAGTETPAR